MSLYKVVARDRVGEDEVRPYTEKNLSPPRAPGTNDDATTLSDSLLAPWELSDAAPLLFLLAAEEKAEHIVAEAAAKAETIEKKVLAQGAEEGREQAIKELLPSLVAFANAGQALIVLEERLISRYTPEMVRLALAIAEKVIGKAVAEDPTIVAAVLDRARREVVDARRIRIWLNPADLNVVRELRPELIHIGDEQGRTIEIASSEEIGRGGCRVETEMGTVDATVPTQLHELRRQLLNEESPHLDTVPTVPSDRDTC